MQCVPSLSMNFSHLHADLFIVPPRCECAGSCWCSCWLSRSRGGRDCTSEVEDACLYLGLVSEEAWPSCVSHHYLTFTITTMSVLADLIAILSAQRTDTASLMQSHACF